MTPIQFYIGRGANKDIVREQFLELMTFISYRVWKGDLKHSGRKSEKLSSKEAW
jgi:hypothetical protein